MIWLAGIVLVFTLVAGLESVIGGARLGRLADDRPIDRAGAPKVSIVVAARDEAPHI